MSVSIALVCESPVDRETVRVLINRILCHAVEWIEPDSVDSFWACRGFLAVDPCLLWEHVPSAAKARGVKFPGKFKGLPHEADTAYWALVLLLLYTSDRPHAVLLVRDTDGDESRLASLSRAREALVVAPPVVIGVAHTKRECWVLSAFEPLSEDESRCLEELRRELGFDPRLHSQALTAKHAQDKLSAKRVLTLLTGEQRERETTALESIPLDTLREKGSANGLASFIAEIESRLLRLFDPRPSLG